MADAWRAIDLFAGCGGLSLGLRQAGFKIASAVEVDAIAAETYRHNHKGVRLIENDIREVTGADLMPADGGEVHLLAGCPPCQGFSRVRRKNRRYSARDNRNWLIDEYLRIVKELKPRALFLENVPGIERYHRFRSFLSAIRGLDYIVNQDSLELSNYAVPQRRRRIVVLAGLGFKIEMPKHARTRVPRNVKWAIGSLPSPTESRSRLHREVTKHDARMMKRIAAVPKNGGSRVNWPKSLILNCHETTNGFKDVYGRMSWEDPSPTITGGCINASKGRFVHPEENRAITLLEAALLQTFHQRYYFSAERGRYAIAEMIGNALPPEFARRVGCNIIRSLKHEHDG